MLPPLVGPLAAGVLAGSLALLLLMLLTTLLPLADAAPAAAAFCWHPLLPCGHTGGVQALLDVSVINGFLSTLALAAGSNRALEVVDTAVCQVRGPVPLYCTRILP
jgi:hypothetical protein